METDSVRLFIATASGSSWYHREYMAGCIDAGHVFNGISGGPGYAIPSISENIYVEKNRDILTEQFLDSDGTHLLFVDTDIGFRAMHIKILLDANLGIVSGVYKHKTKGKIVGLFFDTKPDVIKECFIVPGGFLLIRRDALEEVIKNNPKKHTLDNGLSVHCLWQPEWKVVKGENMLERDDVAFSRKCRDSGVKLWMHTSVILPHFGEIAHQFVLNTNG